MNSRRITRRQLMALLGTTGTIVTAGCGFDESGTPTVEQTNQTETLTASGIDSEKTETPPPRETDSIDTTTSQSERNPFPSSSDFSWFDVSSKVISAEDDAAEMGTVIPLSSQETNTVPVVYSIFFENREFLRYAETRPNVEDSRSIQNSTDLLAVESTNRSIHRRGFDADIGPEGTISVAAQVNSEHDSGNIYQITGRPTNGFSSIRIEKGEFSESPLEYKDYRFPKVSVDDTGHPLITYTENKLTEETGGAEIVYYRYRGSTTVLKEYTSEYKNPIWRTLDVLVTDSSTASIVWWDTKSTGEGKVRYADPLSGIEPSVLAEFDAPASPRKLHVGSSPQGEHFLTVSRGQDGDFIAIRPANSTTIPDPVLYPSDLGVDELKAVIGDEDGNIFTLGFTQRQDEDQLQWKSLIGRRKGSGEWTWTTSRVSFESFAERAVNRLGDDSQIRISRGQQGHLYLSGREGYYRSEAVNSSA